MGDNDRGQVTTDAAKVYQSFFVPALFAQWTGTVLDAAEAQVGDAVLDVGCGTGVLACAASQRVGSAGRVTGIDPNDGMLAVARSTDASVDWQSGVAETLPFGNDTFDRAVSQFALMFFTDPTAASAEIARVTRPTGRIALAVWDHLDNNPGYARLAALLDRLFGPEAANALHAPFWLGDPGSLAEITTAAIAEPQITSHRGKARFDSLEAWLHTEIRGWTLADQIDDDAFRTLLDAARSELSDLVGENGVAFEVSALVLSGPPRA